MTLGEAIKKDLEDTISVIPKQTLAEIGNEYKQHIWRVSREGLQPDGSGREKLNTKYAQRKTNNSRQGYRDFVWTGSAEKSFYFEQGDNKLDFGYDNSKVYAYMKVHQDKAEGEIKAKTKKHKLYPVEKDSKTPTQKDIIEFVENKILNILDKPRTLKAKATVTRIG